MILFTPMLAHPAEPHQTDAFIHDDIWWLAQKVDGHRRGVVIDGAGAYGVSRHGGSAPLPKPVRDSLDGVKGSLAFDGELVGDDLWIFDLVRAGDQVSPRDPFEYRYQILERLVEAWQPGPHIHLLPVARTVDEKLALIDRLRASHAEGFIAKHTRSRYREGVRSPDWRKVKFVKDVDVVVTDRNRDSKANLVLSLYDRSAPAGRRWPEVGEVSALTGDGPKITAMIDRAPSLLARRKIVVSVTVLYVTEPSADYPHGRLYQPVTPRLRDDKRPSECTIDQLAPLRTSREVLI